ncbi:MAG: mevalonate kinase [Chloroflexi bacterium]|nr:mevalonate kinase [Chloroflexota bacterium]
MTQAHAPGKVILFGEHAVVYGRPAIAVPVAQALATATVEDAPAGGVTILAHDLDERLVLGQPAGERLRGLELVTRRALERLGAATLPDLTIAIRSDIPVASGMGSGAAVSAALVRALAAHLGASLADAEVSALVYEAEVLYHGTPSGIDNTVVSYARPVYFVRGQPIETFAVERPFRLAIAGTGIASPTRMAVGAVRGRWEADRPRYEALFDAIGEVARRGRRAIEGGETAALGPLMDENQALLREIGVSSPELERLIGAAKGAGSPGAKLVGAGMGGNMIALLPAEFEPVLEALRAAGAASLLVSEVR